jgi:hypothetical protein
VARIDPRTGRASTIFAVNLRYAVGVLTERGEITVRQGERVLAAVGAMYFDERTSAAVSAAAAAAGIDAPTAARLTAPEFDIKAMDAVAVLAASRHASGASA